MPNTSEDHRSTTISGDRDPRAARPEERRRKNDAPRQRRARPGLVSAGTASVRFALSTAAAFGQRRERASASGIEDDAGTSIADLEATAKEITCSRPNDLIEDQGRASTLRAARRLLPSPPRAAAAVRALREARPGRPRLSGCGRRRTITTALSPRRSVFRSIDRLVRSRSCRARARSRLQLHPREQTTDHDDDRAPGFKMKPSDTLPPSQRSSSRPLIGEDNRCRPPAPRRIESRRHAGRPGLGAEEHRARHRHEALRAQPRSMRRWR